MVISSSLKQEKRTGPITLVWQKMWQTGDLALRQGWAFTVSLFAFREPTQAVQNITDSHISSLAIQSFDIVAIATSFSLYILS